MLKAKFDRLLAKLTEYAESVDTPFVLFAIYMIINYVTDIFLWRWQTGTPDPNLRYHMLTAILSLILALKNYWPKALSKYYVLCWYLAVLWWLPLKNTMFFLSTHTSDILFVINSLLIIFTMAFILDWMAFMILLALGIFLGYIIQNFIYGFIISPPFELKAVGFSFIWATLMCIFFSRNSYQARKTKLRQQQEIANISAQVAHDIRSPLAALQILTEQQLLELPESKRILLSDAVHQIRDITNNLDKNSIKNETTVTQIAVLLEHVLSERRAAFVNKPIMFVEHIPLTAYGFFANVMPSEIKRVITNIINNAVEAMPDREGVVNITLKASGNNIVIDIADNGAGIPKATLDALFARGFTTKKTGSGLGLFHARETLKKLGGDIQMHSEVGKGTTVSLLIPLCDAPEWFIDTLTIPNHSILICVDDSVSIWNAWQERFKTITHDIDLRYCANKEDLLAQLRESSDMPYTYLIDYEFSGKLYTGLDLIKLVLKFKKPNDQVYLVTSRSGEANVHQFCRENQVRMIPKFFALKIPLVIVRHPKLSVLNNKNKKVRKNYGYK